MLPWLWRVLDCLGREIAMNRLWRVDYTRAIEPNRGHSTTSPLLWIVNPSRLSTDGLRERNLRRSDMPSRVDTMATILSWSRRSRDCTGSLRFRRRNCTDSKPKISRSILEPNQNLHQFGNFFGIYSRNPRVRSTTISKTSLRTRRLTRTHKFPRSERRSQPLTLGPILHRPTNLTERLADYPERLP